MKTIFNFFAVIILMTVFVACEKEMLEVTSKKPNEAKKTTEILEFPSVQNFNLTIDERSILRGNNTRSSPNNYPQFVKKNIESGFFESEDQVEDLIPEVDFRDALNENFEVIIGDSIYKVTSLGVLYTSIGYKNELRKLTIDEIKKMTRINEKELSNGKIHLYETFKSIYEDTTFHEGENINEDLNNISNTSFRSSGIPYTQFQKVRVNRHTIVGKWWQNIAGVDKHYTTRIEGIKRHRFKASVFSYDYKIRSRAGFRGRINKRNWIGFWYVPKHWDNDIVIESKNFIFSAPNRQPMPSNPDRFAPNHEILRNDQYILVERYKTISEDNATQNLQKTTGDKTHIIITSSRVFVKFGNMKHIGLYMISYG